MTLDFSLNRLKATPTDVSLELRDWDRSRFGVSLADKDCAHATVNRWFRRRSFMLTHGTLPWVRGNVPLRDQRGHHALVMDGSCRDQYSNVGIRCLEIALSVGARCEPA